MFNTTLPKIRTSLKNIWLRLRLALGLTLAWLFALMLLGNLGQEAYTASAIAAPQESLPAAESRKEKMVITESDSSQSERASSVDCDAIASLANVSDGVSNQPSSSFSGDQLTFWSTANLDGNNSDGNIEIFWGKIVQDELEFSLEGTQVSSSTGSILGGFNLAPVINKDGSRIAFFSDRNLPVVNGKNNEDENFEIFWAELNKQTGQVIKLIQVTDTSEERGSGRSSILPSISDDGKRIAFVSDNNLVENWNNEDGEGGNQEIFVAELNQSQNFSITQVTSTTDKINDQPVISGDGQAVVFSRDDDEQDYIDLYFAKVITPTDSPTPPVESQYKKLTNTQNGIINQQPTISNLVSPQNGNAKFYNIAFVSNRPNTSTLNIWVAKVAGNTVTVEPITNNPQLQASIDDNAISEQPSISDDGTRIAFTSNGDFAGLNPEKKLTIFVYDLETENFSLITNNELTEQSNNQPSISGDGTQVAFISQGSLYQKRCPFTDLAVQVTASNQITAGAELEYKITVTNNGPSKANGVNITATVPVNTFFNKIMSDNRWDCTAGNSMGDICTLQLDNSDDLPPNQAFPPVSFVVDVLSNVISGTQVTNTVGVQSTRLDRIPDNNTDVITTMVIRDINLSIDTTVATVSVDDQNDAQVVPGERLTYTLAIKNEGTSDATNVYITNRIPLSTTFIPAENDGELGDELEDGHQIVTWEPFTVSAPTEANPDTTVYRKIVLELQTPVLAGVEILTNTARGFAFDDQQPVEADSLTTTVKAEPELRLTKNDNGVDPKPGETYAYTLRYFNNGTQDATGVVLTETVPINTSFNEAQSHEGWICPDNGAAGTDCTFSIGALRGDGTNAQVLFAVTVDNPVPAGAHTITNTAIIDDDHENGVDPEPDNNQNTISTELDAEPDLTISKDDGGVIPIPNSANDMIIYTLTYINNGDQGATGVTLTEIVPDDTDFNSALSHEDWICSNSKGTCTFKRPNELPGGATIGTIGSSDTITFAVTVRYPFPAGVTHVTNTVSIEDDGLNGNDPTNNNSDEITTTVNAAPNLTITKTDNDTEVEPGDQISYTLSYSNTGNQDTTDVVLSDTIPANTKFNQSANVNGWDCGNNYEAGNSCTLDIKKLEVNTSYSVTFPVTVINPVPIGAESITNRASITDTAVNGADLDPQNNEASDVNNLLATPELELTIDDGGITASPSDTIVYSLNYTNAGNQEAINVVLSETIPANTTFNAAASHPSWLGCADNSLPGTNCTFDVGSLKGLGGIGYTGTITFAVTVNNPVPSGVIEINNQARIADNNDNNPLTSATDDSATPVEASPELQLDKDDNDSEVEPGDTITYTLTYTNAGNQDTVNLTITETVPDNTRFNLAASSQGWNGCPNNSAAGTVCTYSIPSLRGGEEEIGVITFVLTVTDPVPAGVLQIVNSASITDNAVNGADLVLGNNSDYDTNQLDAAPDLQVTIDDGGITTEPSQNIVYTLTYTNAGNQGATGIVITETVPDETIFNSTENHPHWNCEGDTCTYDVGSLPGGSTINSTGMVSFTVTVVESIAAGRTQIINTATIDDDGMNGNDAVPVDNTDIEQTPVTAEPILELAISDGVTDVFANDSIVYTLTITNTGNQTATNIVLTDRLPINTTFQSATSNGQHNNDVVTWTIPSLAGGDTTVIRSVNAKVMPNLPAGRHELENLANVSDDGQNSNMIGVRKTASATDTNTARSAFMSIMPANKIVNEEDTFNVTVQVIAGNLNINQVFAYLNFDKHYLKVTALTVNPVLPTNVADFNNTTGEINIETTYNQTPSVLTGTFDLVQIEFKAIADSPHTSLSFNTADTRNTSVRAYGLTNRFLTDKTDATVQIQDFGLTLGSNQLAVCIGQNSSTTVNLTAINGFNHTVTLTSPGQPNNTTVNFSTTLVTPPGNSTVTVNATAVGIYNFNIMGSVGGLQHSETLSLQIQDVPGSVTLNPLNDNSTTPTFTWQAASAADSYDIEIATDAQFTTIVRQQRNLTTTSYTPNPPLNGGTTYFWRVQANNGCGSVLSAPSSFTTHQFVLNATPASQNICKNNATQTNYTITVVPSLGFDDNATLSVDNPNKSSAAFNTNPVTSADYTSILRISDIDQVSVGSYTININGTAASDNLQRSTSVDLNVQDVPSQVVLTSPAYNQSNVPRDTITFGWNAIAGATTYDIQISKNDLFPPGQTHEVNVASNTYPYTPNAALDANTRYYWQVRAKNGCGNGQYSSRFQFTTAGN